MTKAKNTQIDTSVLDATLKRFNDSWNYAKDNWHGKWERNNKLYDNERVNSTYEGVTNTFVPMVFSTVETMVAALSNASVRFEFKSGNPVSQFEDKALNALIQEWWDEDQWDLAIEEGFRETLVTGMVGNMFSWVEDRPHLESFAMRDAIVDPTIKKPGDLQKPGAYAGRRYFVRKGTLDKLTVVDADPESKTFGQLIPRYKKTDDDSTGKNGEEDDKQTKEIFSGSTLTDASKDQDEIIEIWDIDRVVTIKNRKHVIEDCVNPFKLKHELQLRKKYLDELQEGEDPAKAMQEAKEEATGIVPFFFFRNYRKLSLFYSTSEVDAIAKPQELLNDMTNMETDYIIKQLSPQKELDPEYADLIDMVTSDPDVVYLMKPGSLVDRPVPMLPANSFNNRMNIKNEIRETTAIDQVAKGIANIKDTTATEVNAQLQQSGQRIQSKARIFEKDGFYWMGWVLMKFIQLYMEKPMVVEVAGDSGIDAQTALEKYGIELPKGCGVFDPADFDDDFRIRVSLDADAESNKMNNQRAVTQAYGMLIQDPTNNLEEIKKRLLPKMLDLDKEDLDAILTPPTQPAIPGVTGEAPQEMTQDSLAIQQGAPEPQMEQAQDVQGVAPNGL
jgi:hypothetical protein